MTFTATQTAAIAMLNLANNGITLAQSVGAEHRRAVAELIEAGVVVKTTAMMFGFGAVPAYKLA